MLGACSSVCVVGGSVDGGWGWAVGASTSIAVNSRFTAGVFKEAFRRIGPRFDPVVLYPAINLDSFVPPKTTTTSQPGGDGSNSSSGGREGHQGIACARKGRAPQLRHVLPLGGGQVAWGPSRR